MALRYVIAGLPKGLAPIDELSVAPAIRAPHDVKFRRDADLARVAREVLQHPRVRLMAAVNAGKTSRMPVELAKASGGLVIYVTGNPSLVYDVYTFACKMSDDKGGFPPLALCQKGGLESLPRTGVLYCSGADYVATLVKHLERGVNLDSHTIFLDEAHKSDAFTQICRGLCHKFGANTLAMASATFDAEGGFRREGGGDVREHEFRFAQPVVEWNVSDPGKPWSVQGLSDNIVIFTDSRSDAAHLLQEYKENGLLAYRLTSDMTIEAYSAARLAMNDKRGPPVAIVADSTFRDGFTFNASRAVDVGQVGYYKYVPGGVSRAYRPLFMQERVQTSGRFGRRDGTMANYYYPAQEYPRVVCDLEHTELEAAAYMYRLLGYAPSGELTSAVMARDVLPRAYDFATVVNSKYPLQHYTRDERGGSRSPPGSPRIDLPSYFSAVDGDDRIPSTEGKDDWYPRARSEARLSARSDESYSTVPMSPRKGVDDFSDIYDGIHRAARKMDEIVEGEYVTVALPKDVPMCVSVFPRGIASVKAAMPRSASVQQLEEVASSFSLGARDRALIYMRDHYNTELAFSRAVEAALCKAHDDGLTERPGPGFVDEVHAAVEARAECLRNMEHAFPCIKALACGHRAVRHLTGDVPAEASQAKRYYDRFLSLVEPEYDDGYDANKLSRDADDFALQGRHPRRLTQTVSARARKGSVRHYKGTSWFGMRGVSEYSDGDGNWRETYVETNVLGRLISGGVTGVSVSRDGIASYDTGQAKRRISYGSGRVKEIE